MREISYATLTVARTCQSRRVFLPFCAMRVLRKSTGESFTAIQRCETSLRLAGLSYRKASSTSNSPMSMHSWQTSPTPCM